MNGRHSAIAISVSLIASGPAFAGDFISSAATPRQMAHCMVKRLRANTAESYRDAFKACRNEFDSMRPEQSPDTRTAAVLPDSPKK
jgi:hypothetical protein